MIVTLTQEEMSMAAFIGCRRRVESVSSNRKENHGRQAAQAWDIDVEGAAAEMAYCKFRGTYWSASVNSFKGADVGKNIQVRGTHHKSGSLIVRGADNDNHFYVLVVGSAPTYRICGWIRGSDAKQEKYKKAPNGRPPAYFVPQSDLLSFDRV